MKVDKLLQEVWDWKEQIYNEVKELSLKEQIDFVSCEAKKAAKNFPVRLKKFSKDVVIS